MKAILRLLALALAAAPAAAAVPVPAPPQEVPVAIVGATVHPAHGPAIANGTVVFDRGKIVAVGAGVAVPPGARVIEARGKHVYPGLFDADSEVGLFEIDAVRATLDLRETERISPNARAEVAFHPESEVIPVTRSNGVLLAHVVPAGGFLRGTSAVMELDGWTWENMTVQAPTAVVVSWPSMAIARGDDVRTPRAKLEEARQQQLNDLEDAFTRARAYWTARQARGRGLPTHARDARWESMVPLFERRIPLVVEAGEVRQIEAAVAFAERHGVRLVILGGYDAPLVAELLKQNQVAVIVAGPQRLPARRSEPYDTPFTVAARLHEAGVEFCISRSGRRWNARNLPYSAAMSAAFGLPRDEALRAITLYPARILGVADRVGSLEPGKDATLFVADGDVFEIPTRVETAFVGGREILLDDKQKDLYAKYREKYRRQGVRE